MASSSIELVVLLGLRLKGFAEAQAVADYVALPLAVVEDQLSGAAEQSHVRYRDGDRSGWSLTTEGREHGERLLAAELDQIGGRAMVEAAYRKFLALNQPMLAVCTRWQVKDAAAQLMNDHGDPAYDAAVIGDLVDIDSQVQPICGELGDGLERFSNYGSRFGFALDKLRGGDNDWFTRPVIESYHTVWFEMHEDLLATLGIDRASEMPQN